MNRITVFAPAKINLFLEVHDATDDGYHNIESIMQTVSFGDILDFERLPSVVGQKESIINVSCSDSRIPSDDTNLIVKAAKKFFDETGIIGNVSIKATKMIPIAAGLAGGSTDGAATILGLNRLFSTGYSIFQMCEMCEAIGADVAFCAKRGTCRAEGRGEKLKRLPDMPDCDIVIGIGNGRVSTRWAYHRIDDMPNREIRAIEPIENAIMNHDLKGICENMYNVFETISPHEEEIKDILNDSGALASCMSGSGSAVYGIFDDSQKAKAAFGSLLTHGYRAFICKPIGKRDAGVREIH